MSHGSVRDSSHSNSEDRAAKLRRPSGVSGCEGAALLAARRKRNPDRIVCSLMEKKEDPLNFLRRSQPPRSNDSERKGSVSAKKAPLASKGPSGCARSPRRDQEPRSGPRSRRLGKNDCKSARRRALVIQQTRRGSFSAAAKLTGDHRIKLMTTT